MILLFLYEKKPFTKTGLNVYAKQKSPSTSPEKKRKSTMKSPEKTTPSKLVASPTKTNSFSPYAIFARTKGKRKATMTEEISILNKHYLQNSPNRSANKSSTF